MGSSRMKIDHADTSGMPAPTRDRDGVEVIDVSSYAPFLLNAVSNAWGRKTSTIYRRDFDVGLSEWRVLSMLNIEPRITARRICDVLRQDKAAVSRSLKALLQKGLLRYEQTANDPRKRVWSLSPEGLKTHDALMTVALSCERELVSDIDSEDFSAFLRVMHQMLSNMDPE